MKEDNENDDAEPIEGVIMVIDVISAEDNVDSNYITYFQSQSYNGQLTYTNLVNINQQLKVYRINRLENE